MKPMHLPTVENNPGAEGAYADLIAAVRTAGQPVSQIWHLFAYKPAMSQHLERLTHEVMRGPSPLSAGWALGAGTPSASAITVLIAWIRGSPGVIPAAMACRAAMPPALSPRLIWALASPKRAETLPGSRFSVSA